MTRIRAWRRLSGPALALLFTAAGCGQSESGFEANVPVDPAKLVPAGGTVKVQGKPLAGAVVMLMNSSGIPAVGESGSDGRFELDTASNKGALPGKYQVTISYMVSPKGKPQGLGPRSAMVRSPEMLEAVELMPPEYSDLKKTRLNAEVGEKGANLDFDVPVTLEPPKPRAKTETETDAKEAPKTQPSDKDAEKPHPAATGDDTPTSSKARDMPSSPGAPGALEPQAEKKGS